MNTTTKLAEALEAINGHSVHMLANMADGSYADNDEAVSFLTRVRDAFTEAAEWAEGVPDDEAEHEGADGAVPVYNHDRMMALVGTRAYIGVDVEYASGGEDILTLAGYVLYEVARGLWVALTEELTQALEDES